MFQKNLVGKNSTYVIAVTLIIIKIICKIGCFVYILVYIVFHAKAIPPESVAFCIQSSWFILISLAVGNLILVPIKTINCFWLNFVFVSHVYLFLYLYLIYFVFVLCWSPCSCQLPTQFRFKIKALCKSAKNTPEIHQTCYTSKTQ